jgi:hypothetical protein
MKSSRRAMEQMAMQWISDKRLVVVQTGGFIDR